MSPSNNTNDAERGYIIPIGGAEEKLNNPEILDRFVTICGGKNARISIIPTASERDDTGRNYEKLFRRLGVRHARVLPFETREECQSSPDLDYIDKSDGIFMTGGNQLRLSTTLGGTEAARRIRRRNAAGIILAHNHPSSDCSPSSEDVACTRSVIEAGDLLDIPLLDHVIIGKTSFVSLKERGLAF